MRKYFSVLIILTLVFFVTNAQADTDKVYNKIIQTQTINCGYTEWAPFLIIDPNTRQVSGLMPDIWETIGKKLELKVVWKSLVGWGDITEAIRANKFDIFCVGVWPDAGRMKNMLLSRPVFYNPLYLFARADDTRFDNSYDVLNDSAYAVVGQEGDLTASLLAMKFPKARASNLPPMSTNSDTILSIVTKKGDVGLFDLPNAEEYMKTNPGKIRQVKGPPVGVLPTALPFGIGEHQLKSMIDAALNDLINDGTIAALIKKYQAKETYAPEPDVKIPDTK